MNQVPPMPEMPQAPVVPQGVPQAPSMQAAPQTQQGQPSGGSQMDIVSKITYTSTQLFEVTGFLDISREFPTANAFVMFVPGQPDSTKQSGRTYVQAQKEIMKINIRDVYAMGEALKMAALYNTCDFVIFTDSTKSAFHKEGQASTKKITISAAPSRKDPNKYSIFLTYQGNQKITLVLDKWHALGVANQLLTLAQYTEEKKFEKEKEVHLRRISSNGQG